MLDKLLRTGITQVQDGKRLPYGFLYSSTGCNYCDSGFCLADGTVVQNKNSR